MRQLSIAAGAVLVALAVTGCGSSNGGASSATTASSPATTGGTDMAMGSSAHAKMTGYDAKYAVTVEHGKVVGGPMHWPANMNDHVALTVKSDVADSVHVRCVDEHGKVEAGGQVTVRFDASTSGACKVEFERARLQLGVFDIR